MFTGIIEEVGTVERVTSVSRGRQFRIACHGILEELEVDDSVSMSGVCLTVTKVEKGFFEATAVDETLQRSTLGRMKPRDRVNLERALRLSDRLGGHFVQGHVDGVGKVASVTAQGANKLLWIEILEDLSMYIIEKGSISVDGVSLTIAELQENRLMISLIPHTLQKTTLGFLRKGMGVNIEVDFIGKYVERFLTQSYPKKSKMEEMWLRSMGY